MSTVELVPFQRTDPAVESGLLEPRRPGFSRPSPGEQSRAAHRSGLALFLALAFLAGCATTAEGPSGQGGAQFKAGARAAPSLPPAALYEVCWPADATPLQRVKLTIGSDGVVLFEALEGASNSTARCIREIAASHPAAAPGESTLGAPAKRASGWAVLAYTALLAGGRFGPEKGLLEPASLVHACLAQGGGVREGVSFKVTFSPALEVQLVSGEGVKLAPLTESERCLEAVLGSTAWAGTRPFVFDFTARDSTTAAGDVAHYFGPTTGAQAALDPAVVKEALTMRQGAVGACWEEALARRAGLGGGRSVRLRVDAQGGVTSVTVVGNVSAEASTAADYLLDVCLVAAAKQAHFPAVAGDSVYSWVFAQRR